MKIRTKEGNIVEVYKHAYRNTFVNAQDCTTEYKKEEVTIVNK